MDSSCPKEVYKWRRQTVVWAMAKVGDGAKDEAAYRGAVDNAVAENHVFHAAGLGANVLVGGSNRTVALQPLSVQGQIGLDVAAGVGTLDLHPSW